MALKSMRPFQRAVLEQIAALRYAGKDALIAGTKAVAAELTDTGLRGEAGIGAFESVEGWLVQDAMDEQAFDQMRCVMISQTYDISAHNFAAYFATGTGTQHVVYLRGDVPFSGADVRLVALFCRNIAIALDNLTLTQDVVNSQRRLILMLSATIEERSQHLHNHVARLSAYAQLIGDKLGLAAEDLEILSIAAAMHDLGKIAIPDAVLDKPGRFTPDERALMETHVACGEKLLRDQRGALMRNTQQVVAGHHERWDGQGYPRDCRETRIRATPGLPGLLTSTMPCVQSEPTKSLGRLPR